jgi:peptidoglycan/LPS O-acetylase OafA/YrhL
MNQQSEITSSSLENASGSAKGTVTGEHIQVLDGLRGIAILMVLLLHTWEISWFDFQQVFHSPVDLNFIPGTGFLGVELFFFLSAFCLTLPYARHAIEGKPRPTLRHFFGRRAAKIIPSYWLMLAILLLFFPHPNMPPEHFWLYLGEHLIFIHNWFFDTHAAINGVLWSLGIEVQFYLLFPLLMLALRRSPLVTLLGMAAVAQCWRALIVHWFFQDQGAVFLMWHDFQLPGHLDIFGAGIAGAFLFIWLRRRTAIERWSPLFTVLAILALVGFVLEMRACYGMRSTPYPLWLWNVQYRLLVAFTFFILGVSAPLAVPPFRAILANPVLTFFSFISYNLYMWHQWIAAWMLDHHLPNPRTPDPHDDLVWRTLFMLFSWTVAISVSWAITYFWERPFLRGTVWQFLKRVGDREHGPVLTQVPPAIQQESPPP